MNDIITLLESAPAPKKVGKRWLVTVARPGQGSSGLYPEEVLKETGPLAIPAGTKAFFNHDSKRDVRDMVGTYKDGAFWNDEAGELQAYLTPYPRYADVLDQASTDIEASIHVAAIKDSRGTVRELVYDRSNTVDLVAFAGLEGSGLKYQVESLFAGAAALGEDGKENKSMTDITKEEFDAFRAEVTAFAAKFDTFVAESKTAIKGEADAEAVETAVEARVEEALSAYADVEKAIDDADILAVQKVSLKEAARKGADITADLAAAVEFVAEARKELKPDVKVRNRGNVVVVDEDLSDAPKNFTPGRWSKR